MYSGLEGQDTFSDRLIMFLFHFAFFLKVYRDEKTKDILQEIYDFNFKQLELSIREIGYGDQSINKKMKDYLNLFHSLIDKIHFWEDIEINAKSEIFNNLLNKSKNKDFLVAYFDKYFENLKNNTLNSYLKSVVKA